MDIWAWVSTLHDELTEAGQTRMADMLYSISNHVHENRIEQVEALVPEALATARAMKNPWLEVFFRHWGLQNRVSNLSEGTSALPEAVSLMEFAHRDDTIACPQSICVTHDIVICYGNADGPGWVPERQQACEETLARMEPSRNCYDCISREYASTLLDAGKPEEAIAYLAAQADKMKEAGSTLSVAYQEVQVDALRQAGRLTEALAQIQYIDQSNQDDDDDGDRISRAVVRAQILAQMERDEEAWEALPRWSDIVPLSYRRWVATISLLAARREGENNWRLGRVIQKALDHMVKVGAPRRAIEVAGHQIRLAVARNASWTAERALKIAQAELPKLRADMGAAQTLEQLASLVAALRVQRPLPVPADQLLEHLQQQEERNPEQDVEWLLQASEERPDDGDLCSTCASALNACAAHSEAQTLLWKFTQAHPTDAARAFELLNLLLETNQDAEVERLATLLEPAAPAYASWCRARLASERARWAEVGTHIQALLTHEADAIPPRNLWASAAMKQQDFATAQRLYTEIVELNEKTGEESKNSHWDLMCAASAAQDWVTVRRIAKEVGVELDPVESETLPIEETWGWVRLRFEEEGEEHDYFAMRTGPVTARIHSIAPPSRKQHVKDWVVFDPRNLESPPEDEKEREDFIPVFNPLHTLEAANYKSWFIDGAHPGEEALTKLRENLEAKNWSLRTLSGSDYTVKNPQAPEGEQLPGLYFFVASPPEVSPDQAHKVLSELTAAWSHPACWLRLANEAKLEVEKHERIREQYAL